MQKIRLVVRFIDIGTEWVGRIASPLILLVMVFMFLEVVLRYGFNRPTIWAWDISVQLAAAFALLGGAYTFLHHGHVRVDVLYNRFPPKVKAIAELSTLLLFFLFCVVLLWQGGEMAWASLMVREVKVTILAPPLYPLKILLVVATFLLLLQGIASFIRNLSIVITGKEIA